MKAFKKILTLLLALALAFSVVACGEIKPCEEHIDENNDGVCDRENCGELIPGKAVSEAVATTYVDAVFEAIESAKTITLTAEIDTTIIKGALRDKTGNLMYSYIKDKAVEILGVAEMTLSFNEEKLDFKCQLDLTAKEGEKSEQIHEAVCFIDGILYKKAVNDVWYGERISTEDIMEMLPEAARDILAGVDFDSLVIAPKEEDFAKIRNAINEAVGGMFTVNSDGSIGIGFDLAEKINPYISALKAIDGEDTIASVVNPYLMSMGITSTFEELVDVVSASGKRTVGELYSALNVYLTQETGKNLQGIYDEIMAIEGVKAALITAEVCDEAGFEQIKAIKLDDVIAEYSTLTVDRLAATLFGEGVTIAQLGAQIKAIAMTPFAEFEGFSVIETALDLTSCETAYGYFNINLDENGFSGLSIGSDISFKTVVEMDAKKGVEYYSVLSVDLDFDINIISISAEETTITLPEGVVIPPLD